MVSSARRRWIAAVSNAVQLSAANLHGVALLLTLSLCACQRTASTQETTMNHEGKEVAYLNVSAISYIDRPIFAVKLNGVEVGAGGGSVVTGVAVPLGPQVVTWRLDGPKGMSGNGDTVSAANQPILTFPAPEMRYLGVHIYPDDTVEVVLEEFWPERTDRGEALLREQEKKRVP